MVIYAGGRDISADTQWDTVSIEDAGANVRSTSSLRINGAISAYPEVYDQALLRVYDATSNADVFAGYIRSRRPAKTSKNHNAIDLIADDAGGLLDDAFIPFESRPVETMQARIGFLWGKYAGTHLSGDLSLVASIGGSLPTQTFAGVTLRQAIESTISQASASAEYYLDANTRLHIFTSESNAAPKDIDADAPTTSYRTTLLATVPISYWRLGEASGTVATDEMGANNGTYVNTPTLGVAGALPGDGDTAATMATASNEYVTIGTTGFPMGAAARTLLCWVKTTTNARQAFFGYGAAGAFGTFNLEYIPGLGLMLVGYAGGDLASNNVTVIDGNWHQVAVTFDGTTVRLYQDAVEIKNGARALNTVGVGAPSIGRQSYTDATYWPMNGSVDEAAIWGRALSPTEIADLYAVGTTGAHADGSSDEVAPLDLSIDYDSNTYYNRVYIQGATPVGSGFYQNGAAIAAANGMVRTGVVNAPDCETAAMAAALAAMYLGRVDSASGRGKFSVTSDDADGWRAGMNVLITSADLDLSAQSFRISRVNTTVIRPGSAMKRRYAVEFGGSRASGNGGQSEGLGSGQLVSGNLGGASNTYVTGDGVAVTDGTTVRAYIGKLPNGDYGVKIVSSTGAVLIDGETITLTGSTGTVSGSQVSGNISGNADSITGTVSGSKLSGGTIPSGVALGISQTTITSSGVVVNDGTYDRVILGDI